MASLGVKVYRDQLPEHWDDMAMPSFKITRLGSGVDDCEDLSREQWLRIFDGTDALPAAKIEMWCPHPRCSLAWDRDLAALEPLVERAVTGGLREIELALLIAEDQSARRRVASGAKAERSNVGSSDTA